MNDDPMDQSDRPPHPLDYISEDAIQDLWGIGYTIVKRTGGDPFNVPPEMVPHTRSYQWWHLVHDKFHFENRNGAAASGWAPVPASRHDGYFMPFGHKGDIEVGGLGLFEKSKVEVNQELAANTAAAHRLTADWIEQHGGMFSGAVNVGDVELLVGDDALAKQMAGVGDIYATSKSKTIETTVKIPKEMIPHMAAIFAERDYLAKSYYDESHNDESEFSTLTLAHIDTKFRAAMDKNPLGGQWPILHAIVLPIAIENVRKILKEETKS